MENGEEGNVGTSCGPSVTNYPSTGMVTLSIVNYVVHHSNGWRFECLLRLGGPGEGVGFYSFVVGVQSRFEEKNSRDAAGHLLDVADFVLCQRSPQ